MKEPNDGLTIIRDLCRYLMYLARAGKKGKERRMTGNDMVMTETIRVPIKGTETNNGTGLQANSEEVKP